MSIEAALGIAAGLLAIVAAFVRIGQEIGTVKADLAKACKENEEQSGAMKELATRDQLRAVEERMKEDREKNSTQHEAFYATGRAVEGLAGKVETVSKQIEAVQTDIRMILDRLPAKGA